LCLILVDPKLATGVFLLLILVSMALSTVYVLRWSFSILQPVLLYLCDGVVNALRWAFSNRVTRGILTLFFLAFLFSNSGLVWVSWAILTIIIESARQPFALFIPVSFVSWMPVWRDLGLDTPGSRRVWTPQASPGLARRSFTVCHIPVTLLNYLNLYHGTLRSLQWAFSGWISGTVSVLLCLSFLEVLTPLLTILVAVYCMVACLPAGIFELDIRSVIEPTAFNCH